MNLKNFKLPDQDDSSEEEFIEIPKQPKTSQQVDKNSARSNNKRGKNTTYEKIKTFSDKDDAKDYAMQDNLWVKSDLRDCQTEGMKQFYKCKFKASCGCPAKMFMIFHHDKEGVSVYRSETNHNEHVKLNNRGIPHEIKEAIEAIFVDFQKPAQIKEKLENKFPNRLLPNWIQIRNFTQTIKKKRDPKHALI